MNKESIQNDFEGCVETGLVISVHFFAGLAVGRAIEQGTYFELEQFIQQCRWDAIDRIKKMQQGDSYEL